MTSRGKLIRRMLRISSGVCAFAEKCCNSHIWICIFKADRVVASSSVFSAILVLDSVPRL